MESRKILVGILCAFLVIILTSKVEAASVYAITKHSDSLVKVYNVVGDQIELQLVCDDFPGSSAVDLALSSGSDTLFASYDGSATITMYNAKTMEDEGYINPPGEISGMDFCESDQQLLAIAQQQGWIILTWKDDVINKVTKVIESKDPDKGTAKINNVQKFEG